MTDNTADFLSRSGDAEPTDELFAKESGIDEYCQEPKSNLNCAQWIDKFYQKFLDHLNMRSLFISLVFSLLLMNFDTICKTHPRLKQRESTPSRPFFPPHSRKYLTDYYTGNGAQPEKLLRRSDIAVVMYYAPWSRRCARTRVIFENIAETFGGSPDISFAAVNCFHRHGQCRKSYKTHTYPVIVAFIGQQSLMYTGLLASDYIYRWILRLRNPMRRLVTEYDLSSFVREFDDAVIAFFDSEVAFAVSRRLHQFMKAALIVFQRQDLLDKIGFAVVIDPSLATTVNASRKAWIQMKSWNRTIWYNQEDVIATKLSEWIRDEANRWRSSLRWISPETNGIAKSEELLSILQGGATVVVFLDRQVLYPNSWVATVVEQTVMEYYSCDARSFMKMELIALRREEMAQERNRLVYEDNRNCQEISAYAKEVRKCCLAEKSSLMSKCYQCRFRDSGVNFSKNGICRQFLPFSYSGYSSLFHNVPCLTALSMESEEQLLNECCSLLVSKNQRLLVPNRAYEQCARYRLARDLYRVISRSTPSLSHPFDRTSVDGLSCDKNNSLRFVGIDARYGDYILKRMVIPYKGRTVVMIVDSHTERTFFMQSVFSRETFRNFLRSFHNGSLIPHIVSQNIQEHSPSSSLDNNNLSVIPSASAKSFEMDLLSTNTTEDVVLYFSGGSWHGPSTSVMYIYHLVAHYFRPFFKLIKFYMSDVSLNKLPWQYQMDTLPAVLFFPAKRKSSSSRFPASVPLTAPNLIAFIVTRCQAELRWQLALSSCSAVCLKRNSMRLGRIAVVIRNDMTSLRRLALSSRHQHHYLFLDSIKRRSEQLRLTRRLLKILSTRTLS